MEKIVKQKAWINDNTKVVSFHFVSNSREFAEEDDDIFWNYIIGLNKEGYLIE